MVKSEEIYVNPHRTRQMRYNYAFRKGKRFLIYMRTHHLNLGQIRWSFVLVMITGCVHVPLIICVQHTVSHRYGCIFVSSRILQSEANAPRMTIDALVIRSADILMDDADFLYHDIWLTRGIFRYIHHQILNKMGRLPVRQKSRHL